MAVWLTCIETGQVFPRPGVTLTVHMTFPCTAAVVWAATANFRRAGTWRRSTSSQTSTGTGSMDGAGTRTGSDAHP
jgi:hypothetical protein